jgi:deoxyribose-phosphate aldolase
MILVLAVVEKNIKIVMEPTNNHSGLASYIEHTALKPEVTKNDIRKLCQEAIEYNFYGVCVPPFFVRYAKELLKGNPKIKVITVAGFPLGYSNPGTKVEETKRALEDGADEIDMVINIAAFKSKDFIHVKEDIESLSILCKIKNRILKVIFETCLLTDEEIIQACEICKEIGVDFVKTSTGFNAGGAKTEHIQLMRAHLPPKIKIKAAGGIKTKEFAEELIKAGADRIGTSSGVSIVNG